MNGKSGYSVTVKMLSGIEITISHSGGDLHWECGAGCGGPEPDEWCLHMWTVALNDVTSVSRDEIGRLGKAHGVVARHIDICAKLQSRIAAIVNGGKDVMTILEREAAFARLCNDQLSVPEY